MELIHATTTERKKYKTIDLYVLDDDKRLSAKAKFVHSYMITRPENWKIHLADIVNRVTDGEIAIRNAIKELIKFGYVHRCRVYEGGVISFVTYLVFDRPTDNESALKVIRNQFKNCVVNCIDFKGTPDEIVTEYEESPYPRKVDTGNLDLGGGEKTPSNLNKNEGLTVSNSNTSFYSSSKNKEVSSENPQADDSPKDDSSKDGEVTFRRRQPKPNNNTSLKKDITVSVKSSSKQSSIKENITSSLKKLSKLEPETVPKPKRKLKTPVVNLKAELSRISKKNPFQYEDEIFKVLSSWKEAGFKPLKREDLNEIIRSLTLLFDGEFFEDKVGANITPSDVRIYSLQDILRAIRSCRLKAFDSAYYPFKKEFYAKSEFKTWLYNPFLNFKGENKIKSFFLEDLKNPASKIKPKFRFVESQYPKHVEILKRQYFSKFFSNNGDCACAMAAWSPEDDNNLVIATEKLMEFYDNNHKKFSDGKRKQYYKAKIDENEYIEKPSMHISGFITMLTEFFELPNDYYNLNDDGWPDSSDVNVKKHYWKYQKKYERARDFFKVRGTEGLTDDVWFDYAMGIFMREGGY